MNTTGVSRFRHFSDGRLRDFLARGYKERHFFPHRTYYLPKCGPDGFKLANRMRGPCELDQLWEIVIYAAGPVVDEFPKEVFFDNDLIWHQQQFGKTGHIATANLIVDGKSLYSMVHISDLVQRISRRREYKTRVENRFKGWPYMLLNSIMNFAIENDIRQIFSPTSDLAVEYTDAERTVQRELFDRVYDRAVNELFFVSREGRWWCYDVAQNRHTAVIPDKAQELVRAERAICLCHDIERGLGHVAEDPSFAVLADERSPKNLREMLRIENELGVKATYNVLGCFLNEVRTGIESDGHCVAFHSYDHRINTDQLPDCRQIDYRIKGYRPPQSKITAELTPENLCFHNFEWLASSTYSLGINNPTMEKRIVKIPIRFDDFDLYKQGLGYDDWSQRAMGLITQNDFIAFCLHDCYADFWLPRYREFLDKVCRLGTLKTLNQVANEIILTNSG